MVKIQRRSDISSQIKGDLIGRTKKAFSLTDSEKKKLKKTTKKLKSKIPTKKKIKKVGRSIDFKRLIN